MKIGFISEAVPYLPCREGFRIYGANLIRCLSRQHELDLVALAGPDDRAHLDWPRPYAASVTTIETRPHGPLARGANAVAGYLSGRPRHYRAAFRSVLDRTAHRWDVVHVEGPFAGGLTGDVALPKVISIHDSTTARWRQLARQARTRPRRLRARLMSLYAQRYERLLYPRFDRCIVVTEKERADLERIAPGARVEVIGNGTDTSYFCPRPGRTAEPGALVFHGNLSYPPNVAGALELAEEILPRVRKEVPGATLHLVGASPAPEIRGLASRPGIRLSADVADVRPALDAAQIYVCGIRHAGGIKNKLLEAMAMALPVVTYPEATSGIEAVAGTHLLIAGASAELADTVVRLLKAPERGRALGADARRLMIERYSWESRASLFESSYQDAIESHAGVPGEAR